MGGVVKSALDLYCKYRYILLVIRMTKVNISLDSNYFANQLLCLGMLNLLLTSHSVKTGV